MPFVPRTKQEIHEQLVARLVALSELSDVSEGGVASTMLGTVAEEIEFVEHRLKAIRDAYSLDGADGIDLDERVADLPPPGLRRLEPAAASSAAMTLTRGTTTGTLDVTAGALYASTDDPDLLYRQTEDITFGVGEAVYPPDVLTPPIRVTCVTRGTEGNAPSGTVTRIIDAPDDVIAATNTQPITGGLNRETDAELRLRAKDYLSSLARAQPGALVTLAKSFVSSEGVRVLHAFIYEDAEVPGYSELVVDDGSGMTGYTAAGVTVGGTVPDSGQERVFHSSPAVAPITLSQIKVNGTPLSTSAPGTEIVSIEERGVVHILTAGTLSPGDTWEVSGYSVYTGPLRELQVLIEGDPNDPFNSPGYRAAGTRVKVTPPLLQLVNFSINLLVETGAVVADVVEAIQDETVAFLRTLAPGEPLFLPQLSCRLVQLDDVKSLDFVSPTATVYPTSPRAVIRTTTDLVEVV